MQGLCYQLNWSLDCSTYGLYLMGSALCFLGGRGNEELEELEEDQ